MTHAARDPSAGGIGSSSTTGDVARRARATGALGVARKLAVAVVGGIVLAAGLALVVLPGLAFLVIPAGLAILATEFLWARRLLRYARDRAARLLARRRRAPVGPVALTRRGAGCPVASAAVPEP